MAAPFFAYINKVLKARSSGDWKKMYVAKVDTSAAVMKSRFYLDELIAISGQGVIGAVNPDGPNAAMHNFSTRRGVVRSKLIWLNDGGLNTKGTAQVTAARSRFLNKGIEYDYQTRPAWYVSGQVSVRVKDVAALTWSDWVPVRTTSEGRNLIGGEYVEEGAFINVIDRFPSYDVGMTYTIQVKHTNSEGEVLSEEMAVIIRPEAVGFKRGSSPAIAYASTVVYQEYPDTDPVDIGTRFYEDANMVLPIAGGYHMLPDGVWYQLDTNGYVIAKGMYSPVLAVYYNVWISRNGTGGKVGEVEFGGTISNETASYQNYESVSYRVGTHNGSLSGWNWYWSGSVPGGSLNADDEVTVSDFGDIDENYASYNWGYQIYVGSTLKEEGSL